MKYVATFHTHSGAMKYSKFLKQKGVNCETMPVPRKFSSNCGIGVKIETEQDIKRFISDDIEKVFKIDEKGEGSLIYQSE